MFVLSQIWQKTLAAAIFIGLVFVAGLMTGREQVQDAWATETKSREAVVSKQEAKIEVAKAGEIKINEGVKDETNSRIAAIHTHYGRLRKQNSGSSSVPPVPGSAESSSGGGSDDGPVSPGLRTESYADLAERCAVTTAVAIGWQEWYSRHRDLSLVVFGDEAISAGRDANILVEE